MSIVWATCRNYFYKQEPPLSEARGLTMSIAMPMVVKLTWINGQKQTVGLRFFHLQETPFQA